MRCTRWPREGSRIGGADAAHGRGSDHVPFDEAGVPGFWCVQDPWITTRRTIPADTIERVRWDDLTEGAQVLAVFAYNVAELPRCFHARPRKREATEPGACVPSYKESAARV